LPIHIPHSGRSDEAPPKEKSDLLGRFSSLFRRGHAHQDFPTSEPFEGTHELEHRREEVEHHPLEHMVAVYYKGRSLTVLVGFLVMEIFWG
jgi:hypothetical protein